MGSRNGLRRVEDPDIHLLVTPNPDDWSLSGLFDFEPAMRGARECEFASVGLFVARGDADRPRPWANRRHPPPLPPS
jgi:hypothetical protein